MTYSSLTFSVIKLPIYTSTSEVWKAQVPSDLTKKEKDISESFLMYLDTETSVYIPNSSVPKEAVSSSLIEESDHSQKVRPV